MQMGDGSQQLHHQAFDFAWCKEKLFFFVNDHAE
jgi:hypothetical protein